MIFRPWTPNQFRAAGFVPTASPKYDEERGVPIYSGVRPSTFAWVPSWGRILSESLGDNAPVDRIARLSAAAIRSDDPDAFVESVLAAYALGGWRAALQLARADDAQGAAHEQTVTPH